MRGHFAAVGFSVTLATVLGCGGSAVHPRLVAVGAAEAALTPAGPAGVAGARPAGLAPVSDSDNGFAHVDQTAMTLQYHRLDAVGKKFAGVFAGAYFDEGSGDLTVRYVQSPRGGALVFEVGSLSPGPGDVPVRFEVVKTSIEDMRALVEKLNTSRGWAGGNAALVHQVWLDERRLQIRIEASGAADELAAAVQAATGFAPRVTVTDKGLVLQAGPVDDRDNRTETGSRDKLYSTLRELAQDATIVVRATAVSAVADGTDRLPHVVTTVKVTDSFRGVAVDTLLKVRQIGGSSVRVSGGIPPLLQVDGDYLLFLNPTRMPSKAGEYYVTGQAGGFQFSKNGKARRLDKLSVDLPSEITLESVRQVLKYPAIIRLRNNA